MARLMGVGSILLQSNLQYERFDLPRPQALWLALQPRLAGLSLQRSFGPPAQQPIDVGGPIIDETQLSIPTGASYPPLARGVPRVGPEGAPAHRVACRTRSCSTATARAWSSPPARACSTARRARSSTRRRGPPRHSRRSRPSRAPSSSSPTRTRRSSTPGGRCTRPTGTSSRRRAAGRLQPRRAGAADLHEPVPDHQTVLSLHGIGCGQRLGLREPGRQRAGGPAAQRDRRQPATRRGPSPRSATPAASSSRCDSRASPHDLPGLPAASPRPASRPAT